MLMEILTDYVITYKGGFPSQRGSSDIRVCLTHLQYRGGRRLGFDPWVGMVFWRRKWQPTPVFLPEKSHGQGSLEGYSRGGRRVRHH